MIDPPAGLFLKQPDHIRDCMQEFTEKTPNDRLERRLEFEISALILKKIKPIRSLHTRCSLAGRTGFCSNFNPQCFLDKAANQGQKAL